MLQDVPPLPKHTKKDEERRKNRLLTLKKERKEKEQKKRKERNIERRNSEILKTSFPNDQESLPVYVTNHSDASALVNQYEKDLKKYKRDNPKVRTDSIGFKRHCNSCLQYYLIVYNSI